MRFVDSNILIYAIASGKSDEREKSRRALRILLKPRPGTSVQVLQEFYVQATRATREDQHVPQEASCFHSVICGFPVQELTVSAASNRR